MLTDCLMQKIKPTSAKHAQAIALVMGSAATLVIAVEYLTSRKARQAYEEDLLNHPAHREEALATWISNLLQSLCPAVANDACHAAINKLCSLLSSAGQLGQSSIAR